MATEAHIINDLNVIIDTEDMDVTIVIGEESVCLSFDDYFKISVLLVAALQKVVNMRE